MCGLLKNTHLLGLGIKMDELMSDKTETAAEGVVVTPRSRLAQVLSKYSDTLRFDGESFKKVMDTVSRQVYLENKFIIPPEKLALSLDIDDRKPGEDLRAAIARKLRAFAGDEAEAQSYYRSKTNTVTIEFEIGYRVLHHVEE